MRLRRLLTGPLAVLLAYAAVALTPSLVFAHSLRVENLVLHSRTPLPPEATGLLQRVQARVRQSPAFERADTYDVFLCDTPGLFAFFVPWAPDVGAVSLVGVTGNIFVRPSVIERDRLVSPLGTDVPGERTLTYYLAHEVTHTAMARRLGRIGYQRLEPWQQEGIADFIGKAGAFDFEAMRAALRAGDEALAPEKSGLYLKYQLVVEALLREGNTLEALSTPGFDAREVERELLQR